MLLIDQFCRPHGAGPVRNTCGNCSLTVSTPACAQDFLLRSHVCLDILRGGAHSHCCGSRLTFLFRSLPYCNNVFLTSFQDDAPFVTATSEAPVVVVVSPRPPLRIVKVVVVVAPPLPVLPGPQRRILCYEPLQKDPVLRGPQRSILCYEEVVVVVPPPLPGPGWEGRGGHPQPPSGFEY